MIKVQFYDYGCGVLDIENELGITEDVDVFLKEKIPELELECSDCMCDLEDNLILWFSSKDEEKCMQKIDALIKSCISSLSHMQYSVKLTSDYSWYD